MKKLKFHYDERNRDVIKQVFSIMYILNVLSLIFIINYRQFFLNQGSDQYTDIANILVFNVVVGIAAILYLGGIPFPKFRLVSTILFYIGFVFLGLTFTLFKYGFFSNKIISIKFIIGKLIIVMSICAILMAIFLLFAYLGKRKMEKEIS